MNIDFVPAQNKTPGHCFGPGKAWPIREYLLIVIHWTAGSFESCIKWFQAPNNTKSSAHYVIEDKPPFKVVQMVSEEDVAWHAGASKYKNYPTYPADKVSYPKAGDWGSLNPCSIGIELAGPPSINGRGAWSEEQIKLCAELCNDIWIRHQKIKLVDHSRIMEGKIDVIKGTGYKEDVFPWKELLEMSGVPEA